MYNNEEAVGQTLAALAAEGVVARSALFLTSKAPPLTTCEPGALDQALRTTLERLQTSYLDLYLLHWPFCTRPGAPSWPPPPAFRLGYNATRLRQSWAVLERAQQAGLVRAVGLSNIGPNRLEALLATPDLRVRPAVVQTELHPYLQMRELRKRCADHGVRR